MKAVLLQIIATITAVVVALYMFISSLVTSIQKDIQQRGVQGALTEIWKGVEDNK